MMTRLPILSLAVLSALAVPARAQEPLSLADAVARARSRGPDVRLADARVSAAQAERREAVAALLPTVSLTEGWQRGDLPGFVFGALLAQRRFTAADFEVGRLNHPAAMDNFRTEVAVEQPLFDASLLAGARQAALARQVAILAREHAEWRLAVAAVDAYGRVWLLEAATRAALTAVEAAVADRKRATDRRDAGLATDVDVLSMSAHESAMRARYAQASADATAARAELNYLMGESIETHFTLPPALAPPEAPASVRSDEGGDFLGQRPDVRLATASERRAAWGIDQARAARLPRVVARGVLEWNGAGFDDRARSWLYGAELRVNLFDGFGGRARLAKARAIAAEERIEREATVDRARIEIRATHAALEAARARIDLSRAAAEAARESQRITRDRYDHGLATIADLLRVSQGVLDAEAQAAAATSDALVAQVRLDAALGRF